MIPEKNFAGEDNILSFAALVKIPYGLYNGNDAQVTEATRSNGKD